MLEIFTQIMDSTPLTIKSNEIEDEGLSLDFYGSPQIEELGVSYLPPNQGKQEAKTFGWEGAQPHRLKFKGLSFIPGMDRKSAKIKNLYLKKGVSVSDDIN